jgi:hypothetical protein
MMAVQYINGQYYNAPDGGILSVAWNDRLRNQIRNESQYGNIFSKNYNYISPIGAPNQQNNMQSNSSANSGMYGNPFGTAMSGTKSGTLQPYVNRNSQMANQALYGGLLGYNPRAIMSGDAGGTPVNSTPPQFNMQSAIPQQGQGLNFTGFGNRSWMGK